MTQTWRHLLFAHWRIDVGRLRAHVPSPFDIDLFDGEAWLGIVPFDMSNVRLRGIPPVPFLFAFPELNVRTYVTAQGKPGIYFFSLDAGSTTAVKAARLIGLPYFRARMRVRVVGDQVTYVSRRAGRDGAPAFAARYEPTGPGSLAHPGTLEHFLTERYCLYATWSSGRPYRLEIQHPPWKLQPAHGSVQPDALARAAGFVLPDAPPLLHYVREQRMVAWLPRSL
jgi:uncharacterized protein